MKQKLYLAVRSTGAARVTKTRPQLNYDEIEIALQLNIPDAIFEKPRLQATVDVPDDAVNPAEIESSVVDNIAQSINSATGIPVEITLVRAETE